MIELSHLKTIKALHDNGSLTQAANALCLTQSALSHQIRYLEQKLAMSLWHKEGRNIRLTQAGIELLKTAQHVLPVMQQTEETLMAYSEGRQGILRIGVECYPCYEWLSSVIGHYLKDLPEVDVDIVTKFQFTGLEGLLNHHIDILVTPDFEKNSSLTYVEMMDYESVLVFSKQHKFEKLKSIKSEHLASETLLLFPVARNRLDIFTHFLDKDGVQPAHIKKIESIELMMQLTIALRGICVLPMWLAESYCHKMNLSYRRIGRQGIHKKLYCAYRNNDEEVDYLQRFIQAGHV